MKPEKQVDPFSDVPSRKRAPTLRTVDQFRDELALAESGVERSGSFSALGRRCWAYFAALTEADFRALGDIYLHAIEAPLATEADHGEGTIWPRAQLRAVQGIYRIMQDAVDVHMKCAGHESTTETPLLGHLGRLLGAFLEVLTPEKMQLAARRLSVLIIGGGLTSYDDQLRAAEILMRSVTRTMGLVSQLEDIVGREKYEPPLRPAELRKARKEFADIALRVRDMDPVELVGGHNGKPGEDFEHGRPA